MGEKTHEPSEQKVRQAREQGNVARSKVLGATGATLGGLAGLAVGGSRAAIELQRLATRVWSLQETTPAQAAEAAAQVAVVGLGPVLVLAVVGALAASLVTSGASLQPAQLAPDFSRLNPAAGLQRLFSVKALGDMARAGLMGVAVAWVGATGLTEAPVRAWGLVHHDGLRALVAALSLVKPALVRAAAALFLMGLVDVFLARRRHRKDLMMTLEEVKQEHKNSEGDPHQKSKRKSLQKQLAQGGRARGVQKATAVVVNPTHIAIAIRWDETECDAPYLVARGREEDAMEIRKEAKALGIPIVKDIPLARALVHYDVGEEVPEELYRAAAAVLRVALEASGPVDGRLAGGRP